MRKIIKDCVGCTSMGLPCMGSACNVGYTEYFCDRCENEFEPEELFVNDYDEELCDKCFLSDYKTVKELED
jgi:hypothetical protein